MKSPPIDEHTRPSAPPEDFTSYPVAPRVENAEFQRSADAPVSSNMDNPSARQLQQHYQPYPTSGGGGNSSGAAPPPPSYQDAVNYPPPPPNYQPLNYALPPPKPPLSSGGADTPYPAYPHYNASTTPSDNSGGGAAPSNYTYIINQPQNHAPPPTAAVTVISAGNCMHCLTGTVENETDLCCLLCMIILAICTFPFGLVLFFCIPCTTRKRCKRCRMLN